METDVEKLIQKDLKKIEVKYGTKMKNICSARLQKILEFESGLLPKLMEKFFSSYKNLGQDIEAQNKQFEFENNEFVREQFLSSLQKRSQCLLQRDANLIKNEKSQIV